MTVAADPRIDREAALTSLGAAFKGAMGAVRRLRGRDTHRPGELSYAQYHVLAGLAERGELSTGELASAADLAPASVTQMLDGLVTMGLVERLRSDRDRRIVTCSLTLRGGEVLAERRAQIEGRWQVALAEFSGEDLSVAAAVLGRLHAMLDELEPTAT